MSEDAVPALYYYDKASDTIFCSLMFFLNLPIDFVFWKKSNIDRLGLDEDVNAKDAAGRTALMRAAVNNNTEDVRKLLSTSGVDLESRDFAGRTSLMLAINSKSYDIARLLLESGADVNASDDRERTALFAVAERGNASFFKLLISSGADMQKKDKQGFTVLEVAANSNSSEVIEYLLKNGSFSNQEKTSAIWYAARHGFVDSIDVMIRLSGNPKFVSSLALVAACIKDKFNIVHLCMDYDCNVDEKAFFDMTALMVACCCNANKSTRLLISYKANVNATDEDGLTALMYAAKNHNRELIEILLNNGADGNIKDSFGNTYEDYYKAEVDGMSFRQMLVERAAAKENSGKVERPDEIPSNQQPFCERFAWYLQKYFERNPKDKNPIIYKRAGLSKKCFSKILSNHKSDYRPRKQTVLALAVGLKLTLNESEDLLRSSGFSFSSTDKTDLLAKQLLAEENYDIFDWNEKIYEKTGKVFFKALCTEDEERKENE
ncbi:MAG: ankyrin repeat domain-containing protein [Treponema sp.]|nr:ankyrin repeat domain-containing protein [Treponema sp.]